jgi:hypothetical protein
MLAKLRGLRLSIGQFPGRPKPKQFGSASIVALSVFARSWPAGA